MEHSRKPSSNQVISKPTTREQELDLPRTRKQELDLPRTRMMTVALSIGVPHCPH
jgi:hypothetical protein